MEIHPKTSVYIVVSEDYRARLFQTAASREQKHRAFHERFLTAVAHEFSFAESMPEVFAILFILLVNLQLS